MHEQKYRNSYLQNIRSLELLLTYSKEAIHFFKDFYSTDKILDRTNKGYYLLLFEKNKIIATGILIDNHISGIYVTVEKQRQGIGKTIMKKLEEFAISKNIKEIILDSAIPSLGFYIKIGYEKIANRAIILEDNKKIKFFEMKKTLL